MHFVKVDFLLSAEIKNERVKNIAFFSKERSTGYSSVGRAWVRGKTKQFKSPWLDGESQELSQLIKQAGSKLKLNNPIFGFPSAFA